MGIIDIHDVVSEHFPPHVVYMHKLGIAKITELFINEYDPSASLQFHTDHITTYEDMIVGLSLGAASKIRFRSGDQEHVVHLPRRSMYFMTGPSRTEYKH